MSENLLVQFARSKIHIQPMDDRVYYFISGDIDENFRHKEIPRIKRDLICIHLKEAGYFNSCGIREWIIFINDLAKFGKILFYDCSVAAVDQLNIVPSSLGGGEVVSFYAPYYCQCGQEYSKLIFVKEHEPNLRDLHAPEFKCDDCGKVLEFDALEESYFQFLEFLPKAG